MTRKRRPKRRVHRKGPKATAKRATPIFVVSGTVPPPPTPGPLPGGFKAPFRWDGINYIWDANGNMAADFNGPGGGWVDGVRIYGLRPRGWGWMSTGLGLDRGGPETDAAMGAWRAWLEEATVAYIDPEDAVDRMNAWAARSEDDAE